MKTASMQDVAAHLDDFVRATGQGPVVVTKDGKAVAVLLSAGDEDDLESLIMGHSPKLQSILEAARQRFRKGGGIPHDEFWALVEKNANARKAKIDSGKSNSKNGKKRRSKSAKS